MKDDLISRQAALNALGERPVIWTDKIYYILGARNQYDMDRLAIETVPSVTDTNVGGNLISKQAAIDAVDGVDWYHQNKHGEMVHGANSDEHQAWYKAEDIYKAIESVPSAQPRWIPCNKRLPEEDGLYLVTRQDFGWNCTEYREIDIAKYDSDGWYEVDNISSITVLAWCELGVLKPWKGGQDDG